MNKKTAAVLAIAVACGLGAMVASSRMMAGGPTEAAPTLQEVLVAARDLETEELLAPDLVRVVSLPRSAVPAGAFASAAEAEGRWVLIKTLEGEPIVDKKLALKGSPPGLVGRIPPGKRAFSLAVSEQSGVSGFILPNHHVDVIQIRPPTPGLANERTTAESVLEDVLILASGTTFQNPTDRSIQSKTVTVAVTADEAEVLTAAQSKGQLSLALRGVNDRGRGSAAKLLKGFFARRTAPAPAPAPVPKAIPIVAAPTPTPPQPEPTPTPTPTTTPPRHVTIYRGGAPPERIRIDGAGAAEEDEPPDEFPTASALFQGPRTAGRAAGPARPGPR